MGRQFWSDRITVEECREISIAWLNHHDYFCGFKSGGIEWRNSSGKVTSSIRVQVSVDKELSGGKYVRFQYTQTDRFSGAKEDLDYKAELVTTPCNFGGIRYWFICPLVTNGKLCRRQVGKLYLSPDAKYFGCRHCYNLTYRCQREHDKKMDALKQLPLKNLMRRMKMGDMRALKAVWKRIEKP